jgi:hypothetical protein
MRNPKQIRNLKFKNQNRPARGKERSVGAERETGGFSPEAANLAEGPKRKLPKRPILRGRKTPAPRRPKRKLPKRPILRGSLVASLLNDRSGSCRTVRLCGGSKNATRTAERIVVSKGEAHPAPGLLRLGWPELRTALTSASPVQFSQADDGASSPPPRPSPTGGGGRKRPVRPG